jgi:hypothetical protein
MKEIINASQLKLGEIASIKFVDENTGQLDFYSPNFPVKWPCGLIDIINTKFSNIGIDNTATPQNRQMGDFTLEIRIANLKLTNSSGMAPAPQQEQAQSIWDIIEEVHVKFQGFRPTEMCGKLIRTGINRVAREDGVQEYVLLYSGDVQNV